MTFILWLTFVHKQSTVNGQSTWAATSNSNRTPNRTEFRNEYGKSNGTVFVLLLFFFVYTVEHQIMIFSTFLTRTPVILALYQPQWERVDKWPTSIFCYKLHRCQRITVKDRTTWNGRIDRVRYCAVLWGYAAVLRPHSQVTYITSQEDPQKHHGLE